jgi:hypothetical protein
VYQRLKEPRKSDAAIKRALESLPAGSWSRAEALGHNARSAWLDRWRSRPAEEWRVEALRHTSLKESYDYYRRAFIRGRIPASAIERTKFR